MKLTSAIITQELTRRVHAAMNTPGHQLAVLVDSDDDQRDPGVLRDVLERLYDPNKPKSRQARWDRTSKKMDAKHNIIRTFDGICFTAKVVSDPVDKHIILIEVVLGPVWPVPCAAVKI